MVKTKKRKREDKDDRPKKRRKTAAVVIKHPRRRSTIKRSLQTMIKTTDVRKMTSCFQLDSTGGDLGGSTMLLEPWRVVAPWNGSYTVPSSGNSSPIGWTVADLDFDHYNVLGVKVKLLWQPVYTSEGALPDSSDRIPGKGQYLLRRWDAGTLDTRTNTYNATFSNPRTKYLMDPPKKYQVYDSAETDTEHIVGAVGKNYKVSHYGKPTMFLTKEQVARLHEDYVQAVDGTVVTPPSANQWHLWIEVLPSTLSAASEYCYYDLHIKIDWYVKLSDPREAGS